MGIFSKLTTENLEDTGDKLGGSAFDPIPSGVYDATIKVAYLGTSGQAGSKAQSITLVMDVKGQELRESVWISNRAGENFYPDKEDSKRKLPVPGFTVVDDICLLITGQALAEQDAAEKVVKIYNYTDKKDVNTPVQTIVALQGQPIKLGILREIVDKQAKDDSGNYTNTGETRTQNVIDKVFHPETGRTVTEYRHEIADPEFMTMWAERNAGKDRKRAKGLAGAAGPGLAGSGRPGLAGSGASGAKKSLFGS